MKTDRPGLDTAHSCQQEGAEQLLIAGASADALGCCFDELIARRVFQETDERFNVELN